MSVNFVNASNAYVSQVQPQPQTHAERVLEKENVKVMEVANKEHAIKVAQHSTVNTQGQSVGSLLNVKA